MTGGLLRTVSRVVLSIVVALVTTVAVGAPVQAATPVELFLALPTDPSAGLVTVSVTTSSPGPGTTDGVLSLTVTGPSGAVTGTTTQSTGPALGLDWSGSLPAGTYTVDATFTPTDPATYDSATTTGGFTVTKAPVTLVASGPATSPTDQESFTVTATATSDEPVIGTHLGMIYLDVRAANGTTWNRVQEWGAEFTDGVASQLVGPLVAGPYRVRVAFDGDDYLASATASTTLTVLSTSTFTRLPSVPTRAVPGASWTDPAASATSSSGAEVTAQAGPADVCSTSIATGSVGDVLFEGTGTCDVVFSAPATPDATAVAATLSFPIRKEPSLAVVVSGSLLAGDDQIATVTMTTGDTVATDYDGSGTLSVVSPDNNPGNDLTLDLTFVDGLATATFSRKVGIYDLTASTGTVTTFWDAQSPTIQVQIAKGAQTLTLPAAPTGAVVGGLWPHPTATVTANKNLTPGAISVAATGACSMSGEDVRYDSAGDCTVTFTAAGTTDLNPTSGEVTFAISKRALALTLDMDTASTYGESVSITGSVSDLTTLAANATPPDAPVLGTLTITVDGTEVYSGTDNSVAYDYLPPEAGSYVVEVSFTADASVTGRYASIPAVSKTLVVTEAAQDVEAVNPLTDSTGYITDFWQLEVSRGASGEPVVLSSSTPTVCTLTDATGTPASVSLPDGTNTTEVEFVGTGTCTIKATQEGVAKKYTAASNDIVVTVKLVPVSINLYASAADPGTGITVDSLVVVKAVARAGGRPGSALYGKAVLGTGQVSVLVDATDDGVANYTASTIPPTTEGPWEWGQELLAFRPEAALPHRATATFTPEDPSIYETAKVNVADFTVQPASQSITIGQAPPSPAYLGTSWDPQATGGPSTKPVTVTSSNATRCKVVDVDEISFLTAGECTLTFSQGGDANYAAATDRLVTINVVPIPVVVTLTPSQNPVVGGLTTVFATARSALDGSQVPGQGVVSVRGPTDRPELAADLTVVTTWGTGASDGRGTFTAEHTGLHTASITFTPTSGNYATTRVSRDLTVQKGSQKIAFTRAAPVQAAIGTTWEPLPFTESTLGSGARTTNSVTGTVLETSVSVCEMDDTGTKVTFKAMGWCYVDWAQPGNLDWNPAPTVHTSMWVNPWFTSIKLEVSTGTDPSTGTDVWRDLTASQELNVDPDPASPVATIRATPEGKPLDDGTPSSPSIPGTVTLTLVKHGPEPGSDTTVDSRDFAVGGDIVATFPLPLATAGDYTLEASYDPGAYEWWYSPATQSVDITAKRQAQTLTAGDTSTQFAVGQTFTPGYTSTSSLPVTYKVATDSTTVCQVVETGDAITMVHEGKCLVTVEQAGNAAYEPVSAILDLTVTTNGTALEVTLPTSAQVGVPTTVRAQATPKPTLADVPSVPGTFSLSVVRDGVATVVDTVESVTGDAVDLDWTPGAAGTADLRVDFTPSDPVMFATARHEAPDAVDVAKAETSISLSFSGSSMTAVVVAPPEPGPATGTITFAMDGTALATVDLVAGAATFTHTFPPTQVLDVVATYGGDADRLGSTTSGVRGLPSITATVTPSGPAAQNWFSSPVTVSFTCTTSTAALAEPCPAPVVLATDGKSQTVTRTITALDGGQASATSTAVDIDVTAPAVQVRGPRNGAWYSGWAPEADCTATDATSGLASCTLQHKQLSALDHEITATATDVAGNVSTRTIRFQIRTTWIEGAPFSNGMFRVKARKRIRVYALTRGPQPQLILPRRARRRPTIPGPPMVATEIRDGVTTWIATWKLPRKFKRGQRIKLGVKDRSSTMQILKVRIR